MKPCDKLTIIRNRHRVRDLRTFRGLVRAYYERASDDPDDPLMDWDGLQQARAQINRMLPRITEIVAAARIGRSGGDGRSSMAVARPDALQHIFTNRYVRSGGQEVLDVIDQTIGVYEATMPAALGRTVNPLFYVGSMLGWVLGLPARFFLALGFGGGSTYGRRLQDDELKRLEAVADRLGDVEDRIDMRLEELRQQQVRQLSEQAQEVTELAERLDFAERVLAQQRALKDARSNTPS